MNKYMHNVVSPKNVNESKLEEAKVRRTKADTKVLDKLSADLNKVRFEKLTAFSKPMAKEVEKIYELLLKADSKVQELRKSDIALDED